MTHMHAVRLLRKLCPASAGVATGGEILLCVQGDVATAMMEVVRMTWSCFRFADGPVRTFKRDCVPVDTRLDPFDHVSAGRRHASWPQLVCVYVMRVTANPYDGVHSHHDRARAAYGRTGRSGPDLESLRIGVIDRCAQLNLGRSAGPWLAHHQCSA